jgi:hypothetical protein
MFTQRVSLTQQAARKVSADKLHRIGTIAETADGKVYRYAQAGASNLVAGNLQIGPSLVANHTNRTLATGSAIGSSTVSVPLGATAVAKDDYRDGYLSVNDGVGEGIVHLIAGNSAAAISGTTTVQLDNTEPIIVALTSGSDVTLKKNNWSGTVLSAVGQADFPAGVPNVAVTAAYYYWAQTGGEASVLNDASTVARGAELTISAATAGAVGLKDAAGEVKVGVATEAFVSTENRAAFLTIN